MSSNAIPQPRKAEKKRVKLKLGIQGPSGSGKTLGALLLARNMWPEGKVCVVDTENESASLYADRFSFDTIPLSPPFSSDRYRACIDAAVSGGYDVLILDSISQQWDGDGGILRRKEELDQRPGANSWANWSKFTPEHTTFIEAIKQSPIHIIATMRSKQDYVLTENDRGKKTPVKVGMAPIQRDGFDYEFSLVFDVQMDHKATISKNRTGLFDGDVLDLGNPAVAENLRTWLDSGKEDTGAAPWTPAAQPKVAKPQTPSTSPTAWKLEQDQLSCYVHDVQKRTSKANKEYVIVKHNGSVGGKDTAMCFHAGLFDLLLESKNKRVRLLVNVIQNGYVNVQDVIQVGDQMYAEGLPVSDGGDVSAPVDNDFDLPF